MNHISLEAQTDAVRQFMMTVAGDPAGTVLEFNGRAVACIVPVREKNGQHSDEWTDAKNTRRCVLIEKKYRSGPLDASEAVELEQLQLEATRHRDRVAPIPLDAVRKLRQDLLSLSNQNKS